MRLDFTLEFMSEGDDTRTTPRTATQDERESIPFHLACHSVELKRARTREAVLLWTEACF